MRPVTRAAVMLPLLVFAGTARADRVIIVPTADTLLWGEARLEYSGRLAHFEEGWARLDAGLGGFFEVQAYYEDLGETSRKRGTFNLQYGVIQPFPDKVPGIAVGVMDVLNETEIGRSLYVAVTWEFNVYSDWAERERATITIGGGVGGLDGRGLVGFSVPLFKHVAAIGDYDTRALTGGLDVEPAEHIGLRLVFREGRPFFGLQLRRLF
jgi:hypothetical protein